MESHYHHMGSRFWFWKKQTATRSPQTIRELWAGHLKLLLRYHQVLLHHSCYVLFPAGAQGLASLVNNPQPLRFLHKEGQDSQQHSRYPDDAGSQSLLRAFGVVQGFYAGEHPQAMRAQGATSFAIARLPDVMGPLATNLVSANPHGSMYPNRKYFWP